MTPRPPSAVRLGIGFLALLGVAWPLSQAAGQTERLTIWDLRLGSTAQQMPAWIEFKDYSCGSNGGPPLRPLAGWEEFNLCAPDENGLYEVYFEYDDEAEYILRAMNNPNVVQYVGTTDKDFPVMTSALFDADGVLRGIRLITRSSRRLYGGQFLRSDSSQNTRGALSPRPLPWGAIRNRPRC